MAAKKSKPVNALLKGLQSIAGNLAQGDTLLPQVRELAEQAGPGEFQDACQKLELLSGVALAGAPELLAFLLASGVDPKVPEWNKFPGNVLPMQRLCLDMHWLADEPLKRTLELLLQNGATVDTPYPPPYPPHTPLDHAFKARREAAIEVLVPHAAAAARVSALVAGILGAESKRGEDSQPAIEFLKRWVEKLPADGASTLGLSALHAAALTGDRTVWELVYPHAKDKNPQLAAAISFSSSAYTTPPGGGYVPNVRLAAGSTPLDVIDRARALFVELRAKFEDAKAQFEDAKAQNGWGEFTEDELKQIVARIAGFDALAAKLKESGATSGAVAEGLPGQLGVVEAELLRLAKTVGTDARLRAAIDSINTTQMGALGFLMRVTEEAADAFAAIERLDAHRLGLFLNGAFRSRQVLYGPDAEEPNGGTVLIWAKDYPKKARRIFETAVIGLDGDTVIGGTKEAHGTDLWAVTADSVENLGELGAFVREGVAAILG